VKPGLALLVPAAALLLQSCLPARASLPQSPALKWLERKTGRIAIVALDGNVRTMDQTGGASKDVTTNASVSEDNSGVSFYYQFPAWSRDGKSLAFVAVRRTSEAVMDASIWTSPGDTSDPVQVYAGNDQVPRFLSWAPDSSRMVFLTSISGNRQQLDIVPARGGTVRTLAEGSAFAWRWKTGTNSIAVHSVDDASGATVERVSIVDSLGVGGNEDLSPTPGAFEAPAWSADGQGIIMAVSENAGSTLYFEDRGGGEARPLAPFKGDATLDLSPDGKRLAWAARGTSGEELSRQLFLLDLPGGQPPRAGSAAAAAAIGTPRSPTGSDFVAAFSWSPDGSKIAYFVPSDSPSGEEGAVTPLILKVLNVRTGTVRTVTTFRPNPYFAGLLQDYGQYAESTRLWSPDGKYLLYCAMQPDSFDIMVAYADQPIAPRKIADGLMATWSPR
jgi:Tol biopolymer transport system component